MHGRIFSRLKNLCKPLLWKSGRNNRVNGIYSFRHQVYPSIYIYNYFTSTLKKTEGKKISSPSNFPSTFQLETFRLITWRLKITIYIYCIQAFQIHLVNIRTYFRYNRSHFRGKRKKARRRGRRRKRGKREEEERRVPNFHISSKSPPDDLRGERIKMKMLSGEASSSEADKVVNNIRCFSFARYGLTLLSCFQFNFTRTGHSSRDR